MTTWCPTNLIRSILTETPCVLNHGKLVPFDFEDKWKTFKFFMV
jgi:hypothetical protein